jgi:UDP-N-acetylglucosamine 2-epimerase (non-hydrolysing)
MRQVTERPEGIEAGIAKLVGTDSAAIITAATELLTDSQAYKAMVSVDNPYGDGLAASRIADILTAELKAK